MSSADLPVPFNGPYDLVVPVLRLSDEHYVRRAQLALAEMEALILQWHSANPSWWPATEKPGAAGARIQAALLRSHEPAALALGLYLGVLADARGRGQTFQLPALTNGDWAAAVARYFDAFGGTGTFFRDYVILAAAHAPNGDFWQRVAERTKRNLDVGRYVLQPIAEMEVKTLTLLISLALGLPLLRAVMPQRALPALGEVIGRLEVGGTVAAETVTAAEITGVVMLNVEMVKALAEAFESKETSPAHFVLLLATLPIRLVGQVLLVAGTALGIADILDRGLEAIKGVLFLTGRIQEAQLDAYEIDVRPSGPEPEIEAANEDMPAAFSAIQYDLFLPTVHPVHAAGERMGKYHDKLVAAKLYNRMLRLRDEGKIFGLESLDDGRGRSFEGRSGSSPFTVDNVHEAPHRYTFVMASDVERGVVRRTGFDRVVENIQQRIAVSPDLTMPEVEHRPHRFPDYSRTVLQMEAAELAALRDAEGNFRPGWRAFLAQHRALGAPLVVTYIEVFVLDTNLADYGGSPVEHMGKTKITLVATIENLMDLGIAVDEDRGVRIRASTSDFYHLPAEQVVEGTTARTRLPATARIRTDLEFVWHRDVLSYLPEGAIVESSGPKVSIGKTNMSPQTVNAVMEQGNALRALLVRLLGRRGRG